MSSVTFIVYVIAVLFPVALSNATFICSDQTTKNMNCSLYEVTAFSARERAVLYSLHIRVDDMIFVNGVTNEAALPMDILVNNCCTHEFETIMSANDIEYVNLDKGIIINDNSDNNTHNYKLYNEEINLHSQFHCFETLQRWVENKIKKFDIMSKIVIGKTYEKREIFVLKLSTGKKNKAVFLLGGEQGRDWASTAILFNFVNNILNKHKYLEILIRHYDFYVLPISNPDGYAYTMNKDRLWSKNCRVFFPKKPCPENTSTVGINIDRNWYFDKLTVRNEECDSIFIGLTPLSEEETMAIGNFLNNITLNMMTFINLRGFDNLVTIPYGYEKKYCNNYKVLMDMLSAVHDSVLKEYNITFSHGLSAKYMYNFSGNVADWVKGQLNTPVVYTVYMKMEPFILPIPSDIKVLTDRFSTMIKEILLLANTFYGPLFNNQPRNSIHVIILILTSSQIINIIIHYIFFYN